MQKIRRADEAEEELIVEKFDLVDRLELFALIFVSPIRKSRKQKERKISLKEEKDDDRNLAFYSFSSFFF